ncbi:MAG TPA: hypothetical protein VMT03_25325 [Polyangia bacterium]|nr:hypothetical protein [Polyangia bacterium]
MRPIRFRTETLAGLALLSSVALGCAETDAGNNQTVHVVKTPEQSSQTSGISPDKEAEVQLLLQQRDPSTLRCYQDVLDEKHDRAFKGTVIVLLSLEPAGGSSKGTAKVIGGTLNNKDVNDCLVSKLNEFEYPQIGQAGTMQYVYRFEPAY